MVGSMSLRENNKNIENSINKASCSKRGGGVSYGLAERWGVNLFPHRSDISSIV